MATRIAFDVNPRLTELVVGDPIGFRVFEYFVPYRFGGVDEFGAVILAPVLPGQPVAVIDPRAADCIVPAAEATFMQLCEMCRGHSGVCWDGSGVGFKMCEHCHGRRFLPYDPFPAAPTI